MRVDERANPCQLGVGLLPRLNHAFRAPRTGTDGDRESDGANAAACELVQIRPEGMAFGEILRGVLGSSTSAWPSMTRSRW